MNQDEKHDICRFFLKLQELVVDDKLTDKAISDLYETYPLCKVGVRRALLHLNDTELCLDGMRINEDGSFDLSGVMNRNRSIKAYNEILEAQRKEQELPDNY